MHTAFLLTKCSIHIFKFNLSSQPCEMGIIHPIFQMKKTKLKEMIWFSNSSIDGDPQHKRHDSQVQCFFVHHSRQQCSTAGGLSSLHKASIRSVLLPSLLSEWQLPVQSCLFSTHCPANAISPLGEWRTRDQFVGEIVMVFPGALLLIPFRNVLYEHSAS